MSTWFQAFSRTIDIYSFCKKPFQPFNRDMQCLRHWLWFLASYSARGGNFVSLRAVNTRCNAFGISPFIFQFFSLLFPLVLCFSSPNETVSTPFMPFSNGHKKGVEIVPLFYLILRSWRTHGIDKTIAPTPILLYDKPQCRGTDISNQCRCYCKPYLHSIYKPPSLSIEDKISITPFVNM